MKINYFFALTIILLIGSLPACMEDASSAVPKLVTQLSSSETRERNKAALELARYGKKAEPAVPALINCLSDNNGGVRSSAAYALRAIATPEATQALEAYQK